MTCTENCATVNGHGVPQATLVFEAALTALGAASPGTNNLTSLLTWYPYEDVGGFNPLAIEDSGTPSCGWWNTSCVACYCTSQEGGAALAANLLAYAEYSPIVTALREDLALSRWACVPGLVAGLNFWGTGQTSPITYAFAVHVQSLGCASPTPTPSPSPIPSPTPVAPPPPANNDWLAGLVLLGGGAALLGLWAKRRGGLPGLGTGGGFQRRRGRWRVLEERRALEMWQEVPPETELVYGFLLPDGRIVDFTHRSGGGFRGAVGGHSTAARELGVSVEDLQRQGWARLMVSTGARVPGIARHNVFVEIGDRPLSQAQQRTIREVVAAHDDTEATIEVNRGRGIAAVGTARNHDLSPLLRRINEAARSGEHRIRGHWRTEDPYEYRGRHQPSPSGPTADDLSEMWGPDLYSHPQWYLSGGTGEKETWEILRRVHDRPEAEVTVYRAVPPGVHDINPGDWVAVSRAYARMHGMHATDPKQDWPVISKRVKAREIRSEGAYWLEFGYFPTGAPRYRATVPRR